MSLAIGSGAIPLSFLTKLVSKTCFPKKDAEVALEEVHTDGNGAHGNGKRAQRNNTS